MSKIVEPDSRPHALCADASFGSYRNQVAMIPPKGLGIGGPVGVDLCLASEIAGLWARGVRTVASCCGHGRITGYIAVDTAGAVDMEGFGYQRDDRNPDIFAFLPRTGCVPGALPTKPKTAMGERVRNAVQFALSEEGGWREEDIVGLLRGCARYANGAPVPVCERCGRLEWRDGLIATEVVGEGVIGTNLCPPCLATDPEEAE